MADPTVPQATPGDREQIAAFQRDTRLGRDIKSIVEGLDADAKYVHTDANIPEVEGGVATNYIFQFQGLHKAQLFARNPKMEVKPRKRLGTVAPAIRQLLIDFGASVELLTDDFLRDAGLREIVTGAIQDADTCIVAILKMTWHSDPDRDPLGNYRAVDFKGQLAEIADLLQQKALDANFMATAQGARLVELTALCGNQLQNEQWREIAYPETVAVTNTPAPAAPGMPPDPAAPGTLSAETLPFTLPVGPNDPRLSRWNGEKIEQVDIDAIPAFREFMFDSVLPEDMIVDGAIYQPEKIYSARFMTQRVYMDETEIRVTFAIPREHGLFEGTTSDDIFASADDSSRDGEGDKGAGERDEGTKAAMRGDKYAVWERWDRTTGLVYHWIEGAQTFLRKDRPTIKTKRFFPFYFLQFNRVSRRLLGISNVQLGRPLQNEINLVRTHKRQAKRAAYDMHVYEHDLFDEDETRRLRSRPPGGWISTKKSVEELKAKIMTMTGSYRPELHEVMDERQELSTVMGAPAAAQGMTKGGADTATEASIADQAMDLRTDYERWILETQLLTPIYQDAAQIVVQAVPEEVAKARGGPGVVWPLVSREQLWSNLQLEIVGGSTGKPNQDRELAKIEKAVGIYTSSGASMMRPINPTALAGQLLSTLDWRIDVEDFLMPMGPPPQAQLTGKGSGGAPPEGTPSPGAEVETPQEQAGEPQQPIGDDAPVPGVVQSLTPGGSGP